MRLSHLLCLGVALWIVSCSPFLKQNNGASKEISSEYYISHFPRQASSEHLNKAIESIKLISTLSFYKSYSFKENDGVNIEGIKQEKVEIEQYPGYMFEHPTSGSALVLAQQNRKLVLLTCAHIINTADTVFNYFEPEGDKEHDILSNLAIRQLKRLNIIGIPATKTIDVLAAEPDLDLALIGVELSERPVNAIPVVPFPFGKAEELKWGTFVYIIGFPNGKLMMSHGLVSNPQRDGRSSFMLNATLYRGASGGIVLGIRNAMPRLEIVGIVNALAAKRNYVLRPSESYRSSDDIFGYQLYEGKVYVERDLDVIYGINYAIASETIKAFIKRHLTTIAEKGFPDRIPLQ